MDYTNRETESTETSRPAWTQPRARAELTMTNGQNVRLRSLERAQRRARGLGWFSIGLGLAQLVAPRRLARLIGLPGGPLPVWTMRAIGLRELAAGVGILARPRPTGWLWARVAGDAIDLALLGRAMGARKAARARIPIALTSVVGVTALDLLTSRELTRADRQGVPLGKEREVSLTSTITVARSPEEVHRFWRNFRNLPQFMSFLDSVQVIDDRRSRWKLEGPAGKALQWEAEVTEDQPGERIAWRAGQGTPLPSRGEVRFRRAPAGRGTEVHLVMTFQPPGGMLSAGVARLLKKLPEMKMRNDLRRLKQVMEVGEVVCSDASLYVGPHPARPPSDDDVA
jgi:uncharacterized membrane protein